MTTYTLNGKTRADCPVCKQDYAVCSDGRLRAHNRCPGSYAQVTRATVTTVRRRRAIVVRTPEVRAGVGLGWSY